MKDTINRREFLGRAGLTLAVVTTPSGLQVFALGEADTEGDSFSPSALYTITPDNRITVMVSRSEMGQGIHTAIPMIVAEELEADWNQIRAEQAPTRKEYFDPPQYNRMVTAGSGSVRNLYEHLRKAGAAGREMLVQAAAQKWDVPDWECQALQGKVLHNASGRSFSYGELCQEAAQLPVPENPRLKHKSEFKILRIRLIYGIGLLAKILKMPEMK